MTVRLDDAEAPGDGARPTTAFFDAVPTFASFARIGDPDMFTPLPDDWSIGIADVVSSTEAIGGGRYKAVNLAGASVISAVSNALGTLDFPYVFAGDGAAFAVASGDTAVAAAALAATVAWVGRQLGLAMRGGMVPVTEIRRHGYDVRVARFAASPDAAYAMFGGGGLQWAESRLKRGTLALPPAPRDAQPDLSGLSCRFQDLTSKHGVILSILVRPATDPRGHDFRDLIGTILAVTGREVQGGRPVPVFDPLRTVALKRIALNARIGRRAGEGRLGSIARAAFEAGLAAILFATRRSLRGFSPRRYLDEVAANADFRKYSDGLMMTVDCSPAIADEVEERLVAAEKAGIVRFGLHRQRAATVTCVVPSALKANHVHFVDGAAGGYAMAATSLKSRLAPVETL